jgi:hypothetical protein
MAPVDAVASSSRRGRGRGAAVQVRWGAAAPLVVEIAEGEAKEGKDEKGDAEEEEEEEPEADVVALAGSPFALPDARGSLRLVTDVVHQDDALCLALACRPLRDALWARFP